MDFQAAPVDDETLGRLVRAAWVEWAREQPAPRPLWLVPWEALPEPDREVDRRIGRRLFEFGREAARRELTAGLVIEGGYITHDPHMDTSGRTPSHEDFG